MDRIQILQEYISKEHRGIEIGPYFAPLLPKRDGWNVLVLDIFDAEKLRKLAENDQKIPNCRVQNIETVDLIGSAHEIADLVEARNEIGKIDFIVSSHNFEHIPNPIAFLQACSKVLRPGGILSMAIPDKRTCFDYFRPLSTLAGMLSAFVEGRNKPTIEQLFELHSLLARYDTPTGDLLSFPLTCDPRHIVALPTLSEAHEGWQTRMAWPPSEPRPYEDVHCWTFTPSHFRLLMEDLRFLGYIKLHIEKIYDTNGGEFFVHLRNTDETSRQALDPARHHELRQKLLHATNFECSVNCLKPDSERGLGPQEYEQEILLLRRSINSLQNSKSWRLTSPLRAAARTIRLHPHLSGLIFFRKARILASRVLRCVSKCGDGGNSEEA